MLNYLYVSIFVSFPEVILVLLIGLYLSNIKNIKLCPLLATSILQTMVAFIVMTANIGLVYSAIIQIASLYFLVIIFFKIKYDKAIIPVIIGLAVQGIIQSIVLMIIDVFFEVDITSLVENFKVTILCFLPVLLTSLLLLLVIKNKRFYLKDIEAERNRKQ
ncbi:hypothetical protein RH915_04855 [Serpentinicella sp. ANB-PHB4]|uniref:hypothetical protein n=1 Tax=Serpentinicella sp. ANB-PHB4 TaxID=3074076 RepID=UPI00285F7094|nr:hypothetical protein [Serpentinicella sp. ANB-PHB4]MDR5658813.1 hypothetical protein [Serpentinicella sp. ANB-PHB4]